MRSGMQWLNLLLFQPGFLGRIQLVARLDLAMACIPSLFRFRLLLNSAFERETAALDDGGH
jgi:hypothetical protein